MSLQNIFLLLIHPLFFWEAHRTAALPAGIVVKLETAAFFTDTQVCAICTSLVVYNAAGGFLLVWRWHVFFKISGINLQKISCTVGLFITILSVERTLNPHEGLIAGMEINFCGFGIPVSQ